METAADIPGAIEQLAAAISSVPPPILTVNQTLLSSLLAEVAQDLAPVWPSLAQAQEEALLTNSTFLASQLDSLSALLARSRADWTHASRADVLALIEISATRYNIWTVWAPECWAVVLMFGIAAGLKVALVLLLQRKAIERVVKVSSLALTHGEDTKPSVEAREIARVQLQKPARAALGHALNLIMSTAVLVLQLLAWRMFVLPSTLVRLLDVKLLSGAIKILLVTYASDLLFGDLRPEIFLHHFFTFALLFVGQLAAHECEDPLFFRLAQYLLLQATLEQTTYASMTAWHLASWLRVQEHRPALQLSLMRAAARLMAVSRAITFPQKFVPAAFALYWLARMWHEIDAVAWGRAWIVWCTVILGLLLTIQVKFADDAFPLAAHMHFKVYGGPPPARLGPVFGAFARLYRILRSRPTSATWLNQKQEEPDAGSGRSILTTRTLSKSPSPEASAMPLPDLPPLIPDWPLGLELAEVTVIPYDPPEAGSPSSSPSSNPQRGRRAGDAV
ncbi:hypothetical protein JCM8202_003105 [Rhodotorula sphaerocarpa]